MEILKHKVIDLLKSFSNSDISEFKKFISSPAIATGRNYLPLLNGLVKYLQSGNNKISPLKLYSELYSQKKFSLQTLKNRLSELFKVAEDFIVYRALNASPVEKEKILLVEYLNLKLYRLFDYKYIRTEKIINSMPDSMNKFKDISFLKDMNIPLLESSGDPVKANKNLYEHSLYSLCIFLIEFFERNIEFKVLEYEERGIEINLLETMISSLQIEKLISHFTNSNLAVEKVVCIYYYLYKAFLNQEDDQYYHEMRKVFKQTKDSLSNELKTNIYKCVINYCIIRQNSGSRKFQKELFDIYNEKLDQGLYSDFSELIYPVNTFRDYVLIGLELKKYKWVDDFIKKYSVELPAEIRNEEVNLSYAKLNFNEGRFDKCLDYLSQMRGLNYLHYLDTSVLKMCCLYELDKIEDCYYETDKFKHYIKNHREIPGIHKEPNLNFVKIYQKLIANKSRLSKTDLGFLEKKILSMVFISKGLWLLDKIREE